MARSRALAVCLLTWLIATGGRAVEPAPGAPDVDHHQHLLSPQGAALLNAPHLPPRLPDEIAKLLREHEAAWNDAARLAPLYATNVALFHSFEAHWLRGRDEVAKFLSTLFVKAYTITPVAFTGDGQRAELAAHFSRGAGTDLRHVGSAHLQFIRQADGRMRLAVLYPVFPGPRHEEPLDGAQLVAMLDQAKIRRAVVLSVAYWFDTPRYPQARSAKAVNAENTWTADQAAAHPDRLIPFCSLNPVSDLALSVLEQCVRDGRFRGLKLHFSNSLVNLRDPDHVQRLRRVFAAADRAGYAIVAHTRDGPDHGAEQARILLERVLPAAPHVITQIAHLWGGENFAPEALAVYAQAMASHAPGTERLYFDVTDAALGARTPERAQEVAERIRQIGLSHVLYGSDAAFDGHADPRSSWQTFRTGIPLTDAEFEAIARNVAPYLQ